MNRKNELNERFYDFALLIIKLTQELPGEVAAYHLGKQLVKSGTSIAANYEEACGAFSKEDFTYKISIAFKEAKETHFWLRLIKDSALIKRNLDDLIKEAEEIRNILGKSFTTAKRSI
jgi:four helix bundle protein